MSVDFYDPLIDCKHCKMRHRADTLVEDWNKKHGVEMKVDGMSNDALYEYITGTRRDLPGLRQKRVHAPSASSI